MFILKEGQVCGYGPDLVAVKGGLAPDNMDGYFWLNDDGAFGSSYSRPSVTHSVTIGYNGHLPYMISGCHAELKGRVKYIDGCSSSLLVGPPVKGDPCLHFMHVPKMTHQTYHTHPSIRVGLVLSGSCKVDLDAETVELEEGDVWVIPQDENHRFRTTCEELRVLVFHPDSDWGPTDEVHPMLNRTIT